MVGSTNCAAPDWSGTRWTPRSSSARTSSSLPCGRSRRPARPILRPASRHPV